MNLLMHTDVYKLGHMEQYKKGTNKIYSYLVARSDKVIPYTVFYGLQYYLKKYLMQGVSKENVDEFLATRKNLLGVDASEDVKSKLYGLAALGYIPLKIKAIDEGSVVPVKNALMSITNTKDGFEWVVGYFESILLNIWNTTTVASYDMSLKVLCKKYAKATCDDEGHLPFQVHDFGYRGCSSEETAALSGSAHLINFLGTDTIPAVKLAKDVYRATEPVGLSVPATEHSVMCSFGPEHEFEAFENILDLYPKGIVSVVSDTYNLWNVLCNFVPKLKERILAREGKLVFRPDSGDPEKILCGDPEAKNGSPAWFGVIRLLDMEFGSTKNSKGFKVLNPKVGVIYGDGIYFKRFQSILYTMKEMGYASSNLVVGIGGLLLQQHSRDEQGFAIKATYSEVNGVAQELMKDPITDPGKKSHMGLLQLSKNSAGEYVTKDHCTWEEEKNSLLTTVFIDGKLVKETTFDVIRKNAQDGIQGVM